MQTLKMFRHGPLLFWALASALFAGVLLTALDVVEVPSREPARTAEASWSDVESWRASLVQLPLLAASGEVSPFARSLAGSARTNAAAATRSGNDALAAAWVSAAEAADALADSEADGQGSIQAAIRGVGIAGDRLLAAAQGLEWVEADLPSEIDLAPSPVSSDPASENDLAQ